MKSLFSILLLLALMLTSCNNSGQLGEVFRDKDPGKKAFISDVKYEWIETTGGGAFPLDTIHHVDTRAWVEVKTRLKPTLKDYEAAHLLPHPKARATKILRKRNWR
jgi:hypothetical protein